MLIERCLEHFEQELIERQKDGSMVYTLATAGDAAEIDCDMGIRGRYRVFLCRDRNGRSIICDRLQIAKMNNWFWADHHDEVLAIASGRDVVDDDGDLRGILEQTAYEPLCQLICVMLDIESRARQIRP